MSLRVWPWLRRRTANIDHIADIGYTWRMDLQPLGNLIRTRRKERDLTQTELAALLDVNQTTVSDWENGKVMPSEVDGLGRELGIERDKWLAALVSDDSVVAEIQGDTRLPRAEREAFVTLYKRIVTAHGERRYVLDGG